MNLFQFDKLKAPLVTSALLLGVVACSNYDDEISDLSGRIDGIESTYVTISSMETQIAAVRADIPDLTSIYNRLTAVETEVVRIVDVDVADLKSAIVNFESSLATSNADIASIQASVDALEPKLQAAIDLVNEQLLSTIESVKTDLESTISSLELMDEEGVKDIVTEDFLTAMLDNVYLTEVTLSQIQSLVTEEYLTAILNDVYLKEVTEDYLTDILDGVYLTDVSLTQIQSLVTESYLTEILNDVYLSEVTLSQIQSLVGDENEGFIKDIVDAMASASKWVGSDELSKYLLLEDAYTDEDAKAAAKEYFESIKITLITATDGTDITADAIQLTQATVTELDAALEALTSRVAELEGRIQSLVFVPETASNFAVTFAAKNYVTFGGSEVYLTPVESTKKLIFQVSPASWASKFTKENVSLLLSEYTRAEDPFTITDITVGTEGTDGKFTVTLKYNFDKGHDYGYGVALHIDMDAISEDATEGTDFITEYVSVEVKAGTDITDDIVYGGEYDGRFVEVATSSNRTTNLAIDVQYDYTDAITFFGNCDWYVGDKLFSEVYEENLFKITGPTVKATVAPIDNVSAYTLTTTSAQIKTPSTDLIGNVVSSSDYTYALQYGSSSIPFGKANFTVNVTNLTHEFETNNWEIVWDYSKTTPYVSSDYDVIDGGIVIDPTDKMTAEMFNEVYRNQTSNYEVKVYNTDGTIANVNVGVGVTFPSMVNSSSDVQQVCITFDPNGNLQTANYLVVYTNTDIFGDIVEIETVVRFDGIPTLTNLSTISEEFSYLGQNSDVVATDIITELWTANQSELEPHMTAAQFEEIVDNSILSTSSSNPYMHLNIPSSENQLEVIYSNFSSLNYGNPYTLTLYLNSSVLGTEFATITASVTLNNNNEIIPSTAFVDEYNRVKMETVFDASVPSYEIINFALTTAFGISTEATGTVDMVYTVNEDLNQWAIDYPSLRAPGVGTQGKLNWNDWNKSELDMLVTAYINGNEVASLEFIAYVENPFGDVTNISSTDLNLYIDDLTGSVDLNDAISLLIYEGTSDEANIFSAYQDAFGIAPTFEYVGTDNTSTAKLVQENGDLVEFSAAASTSATMIKPVTYTYKATYDTDFFGTYEGEINVIVNEAGVSA
ncbi:MAG: hypothetical protein R3Y26_03910, partial [Rikenellaceae bacterium]